MPTPSLTPSDRPSTEASPVAGVTPTGCCPPFDPTPWQNAEVTWKDKPFLKQHVTCLFHIPLNMGQKVTRAVQQIQAEHAEAPTQLMLSDEKSPWGADIYIAVARAIPGATMSTLSGTFLTDVFEGPFSHAGKWAEEMTDYVAARGRILDRLYFAYTTCPACAKAYGKNYVVLFAKVKDSPTTSPDGTATPSTPATA